MMALPVEPPQKDGDRPRVVAQVVGGARDDPQLRRAVRVGQHPGVEGRDGLVVGAVQHEERPRCDEGRVVDRADVAQLAPLARKQLVLAPKAG